MTSNAPARRPPPAARRVGYVIAGLLSLGFWYVVNVAPGWRQVPFVFTGSFDWALLVCVLLVLGIAGSLVAVVAGVVTLIRSVLHRGAPRPVGRQRS